MSENIKAVLSVNIMKKKMLLMLVQYMLAIVMVAVSVLYVFAFDAGVLPFMDDDYLNSAANQGVEVPVPEVEEETEAETVITADLFTSSLPIRAGKLYGGIYDGELCGIVNIPVTPLGNIGDGFLDLRMGYIHKLDANGATVAVYSGEKGLPDVSVVFDKTELQNLRDGEGRVLFYADGNYFYLENNQLFTTQYDSANFDKGVNYYPSYLAGSNDSYTAFTEGGCWGVKNAEGRVIVPAKYRDVYGASEDRIVAVGASGGLYVYSTGGKLISGETAVYKIPEQAEDAVAAGNDLPVLGCYFYSGGLTRAYNSVGESVMLTADCREVVLPNGFDIVAYSDGVMLLKQVYTDKDGNQKDMYGYMSAGGEWIATPDYRAAHPFYEGLAAVCGADGKWGMIDTSGNVVIPAVFDRISDCQDGLILAYDQKQGNCILGKVAK